VKNRFQSFAFEFSLYHYTEDGVVVILSTEEEEAKEE
jgi:hypothetical protein